MQPRSIKTLLLILGISLIVIFITLAPNLVADDIQLELEERFGENYAWYILVPLLIAIPLVFFLSSGLWRKLAPGLSGKKSDIYNIPISSENLQRVNAAKEAIKQAEPETALRYLDDIGHTGLSEEVSLLSARWAEYSRIHPQVNISDRNYQQLQREIIQLTTSLDKELHRGTEIYRTIQEYLKTRYQKRLDQKMAGRQPVNLRKLKSSVGTTVETAVQFFPYQEGEIQAEMSELFQQANGRLLIVGAPGSGKTTLLLRWILQLLEEEKYQLPVIVNLATWRSSFVTLETWLKELLPTELGVSKGLAEELIKHDRFILLCDGLDEVKKEERDSLLSAMGKYGAQANRQYVVSSRIEEYREAEKDAPVYLQIEVGPLTIPQMKAELNTLAYQEPEANKLLWALDHDEHLREAVKTPFYFNTLQLMFANGLTWTEMKFRKDSKSGREEEIRKKFVDFALNQTGESNPSHQKWLSFLSINLNRRNMVSFELIDLQYDWWNWDKRVLRTGIFFEGLVEGLGSGLVIGLFGGLVLGLFDALVIGLFGGLVIGLFGALVIGLFGGLVLGLFDALVSVQVYSQEDASPFKVPIINTSDIIKWSPNLIFLSVKQTLVFGLIFGLFFGLFGGLFGGIVKGLVFGLFVGLFVCLLFGLLYNVKYKYIQFIQIEEPYQRFQASAKFLHFSILQHNHLMHLFNKYGLFPKKPVHFLKEMTRRHILESDGASWRFRHRILQDYFVEMWPEFEQEMREGENK